MRRQLSYECPECQMTTNTYIVENILVNYNENYPGYSLEFIGDNLSDYVGQRIKCGQCKTIITIPEKSKYSQTKEPAGDDSLPMYTIKRVSKNESLKGKMVVKYIIMVQRLLIHALLLLLPLELHTQMN